MRICVPYLLLILASCAVDAGGLPDDGPRATPCRAAGIACPPAPQFDFGVSDAEVEPDASESVDGGVPVDMVIAEDAPPNPCDGDGRHDVSSGLCVYRVMWDRIGPVCPAGHQSLEWRSVAEQRRLQDLLAGMGGGGTGLQRSSSDWEFADSGFRPAEIDWAEGSPSPGESYTAFGFEGLRSIPVAGIYQFCTMEP